MKREAITPNRPDPSGQCYVARDVYREIRGRMADSQLTGL